jgi:hypothetical protein
MIDICSKYKIDELIIGGTNDLRMNIIITLWTGESPYVALVRKYNPKVKIIWANNIHHKFMLLVLFTTQDLIKLLY